jgi:hypothetical protein
MARPGHILHRPAGLPLPPYANQGQWRNDLAVRIYLGPQAWRYAQFHVNDPFDGRFNVLCLPPERDPKEYRWPVSGRNVLILDTGAERAQVERTILSAHEWGAAVIAVRWSTGKGQIYNCRRVRGG